MNGRFNLTYPMILKYVNYSFKRGSGRMTVLSAQIDKLRKLSDKKTSQMAGSVPISAAALSNYFNGKSDIGASKFVKILGELGVDVSDAVTQKLREKTGLLDYDSQKEDNDVLLLFTHLDSLNKKIVLSTIVKALSKNKSKALQDAVKRVSARISKL